MALGTRRASRRGTKLVWIPDGSLPETCFLKNARMYVEPLGQPLHDILEVVRPRSCAISETVRVPSHMSPYQKVIERVRTIEKLCASGVILLVVVPLILHVCAPHCASSAIIIRYHQSSTIIIVSVIIHPDPSVSLTFHHHQHQGCSSSVVTIFVIR